MKLGQFIDTLRVDMNNQVHLAGSLLEFHKQVAEPKEHLAINVIGGRAFVIVQKLHGPL